MIYFDRNLKNKTLKLFTESLNSGCFLCLGMKETLSLTDYAHQFIGFAEEERIYRKKPF
jgi:chemotaxis protein methyltransferase CheR